MIEFPALIGDIGGTNARFAIVPEKGAAAHFLPILRTADFDTFESAIEAVLANYTAASPRSAIFAIAGPVEGDEIRLTNNSWTVRPKRLSKQFDLSRIIVLNDFEAQALAVASFELQHVYQIGGGSGIAGATRVAVGPGTGLGVAGLLNVQNMWVPVPGEGGHVDIGPRTPRDIQIFPYLEPIGGRISAEQVLSGRGLTYIYHAIAKADGKQALLSSAAEISAAALEGNDSLASEALNLFVTYLGRLAGDLAMIFMSHGGVFLTGGIVPKILPALETGVFRMAFEDKAPHEGLLGTIPVYVVTSEFPGIDGLAAYINRPDQFYVGMHGRCWLNGELAIA